MKKINGYTLCELKSPGKITWRCGDPQLDLQKRKKYPQVYCITCKCWQWYSKHAKHCPEAKFYVRINGKRILVDNSKSESISDEGSIEENS